LNLEKVTIVKALGGSLTGSFLLDGFAFKKTFVYAGYEQQPKRIEKPKILFLNVEVRSPKKSSSIKILTCESVGIEISQRVHQVGN
jgi:T-complex protein 1 subunit eta